VPKRRDPYTVWLGVPEGPRPPNHYDLLGLRRFEPEPPVIADAADERTAKVRKFLGGEHDRVARAMLARLAAARDCLLDPASRAEYERRLRESLSRKAQQGTRADDRAAQPATDDLLPPLASESTPPVAAAIPQPPSTSPPIAAPVLPGGSMPAGVPVVETGSVETSSTAAKLKRQRMRRRRRSRQLMAAFVVTSLMLVGLAVWVVDQAGVFRSPGEAPSPDTPPRLAAAGDEPPMASDTTPREESANGLRPPSSESAVSNETGPAMSQTMEPAPTSFDTPAAPTELMPPPPSNTNTPPAPSESPPPPSSSPSPPETPAAPPPVVVEADERELRDVRRSLAASWAALVDRDVPRAEEQLDLALLEAVADETIVVVARRRRLFDEYRRFWDAVAEAQSSLKAGAEVATSSETYEVIEASSEEVTVRSRGRTRNYNQKSYPVDLAVALAERALGADSNEAKLAIGAFHATRGDAAGIDAARRLWQEAAGDEVDDLLADLDEIVP